MAQLSYPRTVFRGDASRVVSNVAALVSARADGWYARPLPHDGPEEAACYAPVSDPGEPDADPGDVADPPKRKPGRPRKDAE